MSGIAPGKIISEAKTYTAAHIFYGVAKELDREGAKLDWIYKHEAQGLACDIGLFAAQLMESIYVEPCRANLFLGVAQLCYQYGRNGKAILLALKALDNDPPEEIKIKLEALRTKVLAAMKGYQ